MPVDSDSLGMYLRQERERRQVSLQEIAAATKIQLKFLDALERDAYDQLPAVPFVVGFLRAYAQYIALDPEMILAAYRSLQHTPEPVEGRRASAAMPGPSVPRTSLVRLVALLVVLGLGLGLGIYEFRRGRQTQSPMASFPAPLQPVRDSVPTPATPTSLSVPRAEVPAPSQAPVAGSALLPVGLRDEPSVQTSGTQVLEAAPPASVTASTSSMSPTSGQAGSPAESTPPLVLQAKALEDTWLRIEIDGHKQLSLLLPTGKSIQWEAGARFRLTIGNARGTRLALNGQDIPLQAGRSNVVRDLLLTRSNLQ